MYNFTLKSYGEIFAEAQALTGTATIGNKNIKPEVGRHLAGLAVSILASGALTVAAGGSVVVTVETSKDTVDANFKQLATFSTLGTERYAAGFTASSGEKIAVFPLPPANRYIRVKLSGTSVTGNVDCILEYIAR